MAFELRGQSEFGKPPICGFYTQALHRYLEFSPKNRGIQKKSGAISALDENSTCICTGKTAQFQQINFRGLKKLLNTSIFWQKLRITMKAHMM